jgi:outer membrane receptor protein involved in Fe transport
MKRLEMLPEWLRLDALASVNLRHTVSSGRHSGVGDFSNSRTDALSPSWALVPAAMGPNETFVSSRDNDDAATGGYPWQASYRTAYTEAGTGVLFDTGIADRFSLLLGARHDFTHARNTDLAGTLNANTGTAASPGAIRTTEQTVDRSEGANSYSASLTWTGTPDWRPYVSWARSSILLDGNNNSLTNQTISAGYVGQAELREAGIKARLLDHRLLLSFSLFRQARVGVDEDDDRSLLNAYATATVTRGWEAELKWVPMANLFLSMYASRQVSKFAPNIGTTQIVDARALGFQDVVDASGRVVFPAEAFLYGGRARLVLPDDVDAYARKEGNPDTLLGLNVHYRLQAGLGFTAGVNHFSDTCSGRLCWVRLPAANVVRAGAYFERDQWLVKLDALNLFDERYFRARTGDTLGNVLAQAMPGRRWQLTLRRTF